MRLEDHGSKRYSSHASAPCMDRPSLFSFTLEIKISSQKAFRRLHSSGLPAVTGRIALIGPQVPDHIFDYLLWGRVVSMGRGRIEFARKFLGVKKFG